jgi:hypothetical protein
MTRVGDFHGTIQKLRLIDPDHGLTAAGSTTACSADGSVFRSKIAIIKNHTHSVWKAASNEPAAFGVKKKTNQAWMGGLAS